MRDDATTRSPRWSYKLNENSAARADLALLDALQSGAGVWSEPPPEGFLPSRSQLQRWIQDLLLVLIHPENRPIRAGEKLLAGFEVQLTLPAPTKLSLKPELRELEILFEDAHILVINKPAGLSVHPSSSEPEGTLVHALLARPGGLSTIGGVERPGIVHRLDKYTSGALVVSKTDEAHAGLATLFSKHDLERRYWALTYGAPKGVQGARETRIETTIGRNPNDRIKMKAGIEGGKTAITFLSLKKIFARRGVSTPYASWVEARLETGRTHQVRVHLADLGASLLGDPVYGTPGPSAPKLKALPNRVRSVVETLPGQALHARTLAFKHPITSEALCFQAEAPETFQNLLQALEESVQ